MIDIEANANALANGVVVVRGDLGKDSTAAGQAQGVKKVGATEGLALDFGVQRAGVIVNDVVGANQHLHGCVHAKYQATATVAFGG